MHGSGSEITIGFASGSCLRVRSQSGIRSQTTAIRSAGEFLRRSEKRPL